MPSGIALPDRTAGRFGAGFDSGNDGLPVGFPNEADGVGDQPALGVGSARTTR